MSMHRTAAKSFPRTSLKQRLQRFVQTRIWKTDIHPSAWIAETALIDRTWPKGVHIEAECFIDEEAVVLTHDEFLAFEHNYWARSSPVGFVFTLGTVVGFCIGFVII